MLSTSPSPSITLQAPFMTLSFFTLKTSTPDPLLGPLARRFRVQDVPMHSAKGTRTSSPVGTCSVDGGSEGEENQEGEAAISPGLEVWGHVKHLPSGWLVKQGEITD